MPNPPTMDVAIVGAGPAGMVAAAELVRRGLSVRIFDRRTGPVDHSNALALQVRTLEILDAMGIADRFVERSFPLEYLSLNAFGRHLGGISLYGLDGPFTGPRVIGQDVTEALLGARLTELGIAVEWSSEIDTLSQDPDGVTLGCRKAEGSTTLRARYAIGTDGTHSFVRNTLGIPTVAERYEGIEFIHADCQLAWSFPTGRAYTFAGTDQLTALFPFDRDGSYRVLCARRVAEPNAGAPPALAEIQNLLRAVADPDAELSAPRWLARWHSGHHLAERFREGRIFLAGDAAHAHVPVGGQGMNIGMQDAFNLAWKLAAVVRDTAPPALLDTYNPERHAIASEIVQRTDRAFHLMLQPNDFASFAIRLFGSTVIALERVQERLRRMLGEVAHSYLSSELSQDLGGTTGPIAGERMPDGIGVRASDRRTLRLLEMLRGLGWHLIVFAGWTGEDPLSGVTETVREAVARHGAHVTPLLVTPGKAPEAWAGEVVYDREHLLHDRFGVRGPALYLVRPDWYVGFRAPAARADAVLAYLDRWLGAAASPSR